MIEINEHKKELRRDSLDGRIKEVALYRVNIENYTLAIEKAKAKGLTEFAQKLEALIVTEQAQLDIAETMLEVVEELL